MSNFKAMNKQIRPKEAHIAWAMEQGVTYAEALQHWEELQKGEHFANDEYMVIKRTCPEDMNRGGIPGLYWLSIRRIDGQKVRNWVDLQQIKNEILGREAEAVEIFPAESRKVDAANQYHLFGGIGCKFPFGFGSESCSG